MSIHIAREKRSGLTRLTVRPLSVCTADEIRIRDNPFSQKGALSAELQRYTCERYFNLGKQLIKLSMPVNFVDTAIVYVL